MEPCTGKQLLLSHIGWLASLAIQCDTPKAYAILWFPSYGKNGFCLHMNHFGSLSLAKCFYVPKAYAKKETSPLSRFARNLLPHKKASRFFVPQCEIMEPYTGKQLLLSHIGWLAALTIQCDIPKAYAILWFPETVERYMEPSLYTRPRIWIRSLRSLYTLASLAIQILYPPRRVCAGGESHPPARLVIASLRSL